jgi:hypothetical protein
MMYKMNPLETEWRGLNLPDNQPHLYLFQP